MSRSEETIDDLEEDWWVCIICLRGFQGITRLYQHKFERHPNSALETEIINTNTINEVGSDKHFPPSESEVEVVTISDDEQEENLEAILHRVASTFVALTRCDKLKNKETETLESDSKTLPKNQESRPSPQKPKSSDIPLPLADHSRIHSSNKRHPRKRKTTTELSKLGVTDGQLLDLSLGLVAPRLRERVVQEKSTFSDDDEFNEDSTTENSGVPNKTSRMYDVADGLSTESDQKKTLKGQKQREIPIVKQKVQQRSTSKEKNTATRKVMGFSPFDDKPSESTTNPSSSQLVKVFVCSECIMKFSTPESLSLHFDSVHTHHSAMIFRCNYCGEEFFTNPSFRKHVQIHILAQTYKDKKEFAEQQNLNATLKSRHKNVQQLFNDDYSKSHNCNICQRKYITREDLLIHLQTLHFNTD